MRSVVDFNSPTSVTTVPSSADESSSLSRLRIIRDFNNGGDNCCDSKYIPLAPLALSPSSSRPSRKSPRSSLRKPPSPPLFERKNPQQQQHEQHVHHEKQKIRDEINPVPKQQAIQSPRKQRRKGWRSRKKQNDADTRDDHKTPSTTTLSSTTTAALSPGTNNRPGVLPIANNNDARRTRVVSFNRSIRSRHIKLLDDTPTEEIEAKYHSRKELEYIRNTARAQIRACVDQCADDEELWDYDDDNYIFCMRGLEPQLPRGKSRRHHNINLARGTVLEEQLLHWLFHHHDHHRGDADERRATSSDAGAVLVTEDPAKAIAEAYRMESRAALEYALDAAKRDEFIAKEIYAADDDDDSTPCRSFWRRRSRNRIA